MEVHSLVCDKMVINQWEGEIAVILENTKGQKYEIVDTFYKEHSGRSRAFCKIKFLETGSTEEVRRDMLKRGNVKDRYAKDVCEVACIGRIKKTDNPKEYNIWSSMINRCYNPENKFYSRYGGRGIKVADRWLCFEYFMNDILFIDGYDFTMIQEGLLQLDKDIKGGNMYSLENCTFISHQENTRHRDMSLLKKNVLNATGISPTGEVFKILNITDFANEHGLSRSKIYECINGNRKHHKKWRFYSDSNENSQSGKLE